MKWSRLFFVTVVLALMGCSSTTGPSYPQPDEDKGDEPDPDKQGMVMPWEVEMPQEIGVFV